MIPPYRVNPCRIGWVGARYLVGHRATTVWAPTICEHVGNPSHNIFVHRVGRFPRQPFGHVATQGMVGLDRRLVCVVLCLPTTHVYVWTPAGCAEWLAFPFSPAGGICITHNDEHLTTLLKHFLAERQGYSWHLGGTGS
jgi:hypothetical protein